MRERLCSHEASQAACRFNSAALEAAVHATDSQLARRRVGFQYASKFLHGCQPYFELATIVLEGLLEFVRAGPSHPGPVPELAPLLQKFVGIILLLLYSNSLSLVARVLQIPKLLGSIALPSLYPGDKFSLLFG